MTTRFSASDRNLALAVLLMLAGSAVFVRWNYDAAFPQASLKLELTSGEITARAESFLRGRNLSTAGFRHLTVFDPDEEARLYLDRELGLERANRLMEGDVPVWRWRARWFKPPQKEELIVHLRPEGKLAGFEHRVAETEAGARLDAAAARAMAEAFLLSQTTRPHKLIAEQREAKPNRDDHVFTWEQENFKAKDATLRRTVVVQGDRIGRYREFLYVPEQWQRDFATMRSSNQLYAGLANGLYLVLAVASLGLLVLALRRGEVRWQPLIRIAAVVAAFNFANELNTLPFAIDGMQTATPYPQMALLAALGAVGASVAVLIYVLLPAAAGAGWFARFAPSMPLEAAFTRAGMGTRSFYRASMAGYGFAAAHLVFLIAFYLLGAKIGVWSPAEVSYSDVLATPMPWVYPVAIALMASTAEEFWFRLLAVPLVARLVRWRWVALVAPAFLWGFLHANYPQQPGWIRGVEVGLIGVAAGYLMLRFGIVATLVWHYVIDAFLIGLFLFQAQAWTYRLHGLILALAIAAPLIVSAMLYRRNGGFVAEPEHIAPEPARAEPAPEPLAEALPPPWPETRLWLAAAALGIAAFFLRPVLFGDFVAVKVSRPQAVALAEAELRRRGLDPGAWRLTADFAANLRGTDFEYLRQQAGAAEANRLVKERVAHGIWRVRYFQPLNPEEWIFYIDGDWRVYRFDHVLDEKAKGASPSREEAGQLAVDALKARGIAGYTLVDSQADKLDNRIDHSFVWEDPAFQAGEARARVALQMVGTEACEFRRFFKLPEQWLRDFQKPTIATYAMPAFLGSTIVPLVLLFVRRMGTPGQRFHWRVYTGVAVAAFLLAVAGEINDWPSLYASYSTATPLSSYLGQVAVSVLSQLVLMAAGGLGLAMAVDTFLQMVSPGRRLPAFRWTRALPVAVLAGAVAQLSEWLLQRMPGPRGRLPLWDLEGADTVFPAVAALHGDLIAAFVMTAAFAIYACGLLRLVSRLGVALLVVTAVAAASRTLAWTQVPFTLLAAVLMVGAAIWIAMTCATDVVSMAGGIFLALAASSAWRLWEQPLPFLKWNGVAVVVAAVAIVAGAARMTENRTRMQSARS